METRDSDSLVELLKVSIEQYSEIAQLHRMLLGQLDDGAEAQVEEFNRLFAEAQMKVERLDSQLSPRLNSEIAARPEIAQLLVRKYGVQKDIREMLDQILPKAMGIRSLLASEMEGLRNGRRALSGYKNYSGSQGRLVNKRT